jgi:GxxExxY protein
MHKDFERADELSFNVISAAMEVHTDKGPGLLEEIYERCLMRELELRGIMAENQLRVPVEYKGITFDSPLRLDVLVDKCLVVEGKSVEIVKPIYKAQVLSYMKLMNIPLGLLINFNTLHLKDGIHRLVLPGANQAEVDF